MREPETIGPKYQIRFKDLRECHRIDAASVATASACFIPSG